MSELTEEETKLFGILGEISGDSPIIKTDCNEFRELLQNQKLRELIEKAIKELTTQFRWSEKHRDYRVYQELQNLLEESKR